MALCTMALPGWALAPGEAFVELSPRVEVFQSRVRLADIATIRAGDLETLQSLMDLPLGNAPRAGMSIGLDQATLDQWVQRNVARMRGPRQKVIRWNGASHTQVESASQFLNGSRIAEEAERELQRSLGVRFQSVRLIQLGSTPDLVAPAGELRIQVRKLPADTLPNKRMTVWVDTFVESRFVRAVPVRFDVEAWQNAVVAGRALTPGALLDSYALANQTERRLVDAVRTRPGVGEAPVALVADSALRVRHAVRAGEALHASDFEAAPDVTRGTWVELRDGSGPVALSGRAEVLQDGRIGQTVRVRMHGAAGAVMARVLARDELEMLP